VPLRHNRNWRLLWLGQSVSATGDMVFYVTVLLWIATIIAKGLPWAPAAASGALIATAAPVLVVGPLAGVFVDRWDRRRTMLVADAARFFLVASLLVVPLLRHHLPVGAQLAILYAVLAACSCFAEFFDPSRLAVVGAIVPPQQQPQASALLSAAFSLAQVIGPPIAAPLLFTLGVQWALIFNAASFGFSFICIRAISVPLTASADAPPREGFFAEFRTGIKFFAGNRVLLALGLGLMLTMLGLGAVNSLAAFFVPHNLHVQASWLGAIMGAVGGGSIAGALLVGGVSKRVRPTRLFWLSLLGCGVMLIALSRTTSLIPAIITAALLGIAAGVLNAAFSPILLEVTPSHLLGRVSAVLSPLLQLASIVSMVLAGLLASTVLRGFSARFIGLSLGPYDTVFAVGGALLLLAGLATIAPLNKAGRSEPTATPEPAEPAEASWPTGPAPVIDPGLATELGQEG
jgi:MFS family permease